MLSKNETKLYADALYCHLIAEGYPEWKAKNVAARFLQQHKD